MTNCAAARVAAAQETADSQSAPGETGRSNKQKTFENGEATNRLQADKASLPQSHLAVVQLFSQIML